MFLYICFYCTFIWIINLCVFLNTKNCSLFLYKQLPHSVWTKTVQITDDTFERCTSPSCVCGGKLYHCSLCVPHRIKAMKLSKMRKHFQTMHWEPRISHPGMKKFLHRCFFLKLTYV